MRILVTGATGTVARQVVQHLQGEHELLLTGSSDPAEATVADPLAPGGRRRQPLETDWPYLRADLLDTATIARFAVGVEVIVHLAASVAGDWAHMDQSLRSNLLGTNSLFDVARRCGARRLVNASSINAFGTFFFRVSKWSPVRRSLPLVEDERPVPEDPYSLTKWMAEELGAAYRRAFGIEVANLRLAGVRSLQQYESMLEEGLPATTAFPDDLGQWVHIDDVAAAFHLAATVPAVTPEPMVIAAGDTKLREPTMEVIRRFKPELEPYLVAPLPRRAPMLSIARARENLGYRPRYDLEVAALRPRE